MKKLLLLITVISMAFVGCEPMDDIYDDIDTGINVQGVAEYTLTDDDYEELELGYGNFYNIEEAKEMLPAFLSNKYPVWGKGSLANVSFMVYNGKKDEKSLIVYEATPEDGDEFGSYYGNFDRMSQIEDLLDSKFGDEPERTLVSLTYEWYQSTTGTVDRNDGFLLLDGEWQFITGPTEDEYAALGESYPNFSNEDEALEKLPVFLENKYAYENPVKGDIKGVMYNVYKQDEDDVDRDGDTSERFEQGTILYFVYNGNEWVKYNNALEETLQFGHDGVTWVPDNTIKYTFETADYVTVGDEFIVAYPGPGDNVAYFKTFDRRSSSDNYWNDDMLLEAMNFFLDSIAPSAEEGQKYEVTFNTYVGSTVAETLFLVKQGGVWVYQE